MYSVEEIAEIIAENNLHDALREISPESIGDTALKGLWEEAIEALDRIDTFIEHSVDFSDEYDDEYDDDDIDYGDDDDDSEWDS